MLQRPIETQGIWHVLSFFLCQSKSILERKIHESVHKIQWWEKFMFDMGFKHGCEKWLQSVPTTAAGQVLPTGTKIGSCPRIKSANFYMYLHEFPCWLWEIACFTFSFIFVRWLIRLPSNLARKASRLRYASVSYQVLQKRSLMTTHRKSAILSLAAMLWYFLFIVNLQTPVGGFYPISFM